MQLGWTPGSRVDINICLYSHPCFHGDFLSTAKCLSDCLQDGTLLYNMMYVRCHCTWSRACFPGRESYMYNDIDDDENDLFSIFLLNLTLILWDEYVVKFSYWRQAWFHNSEGSPSNAVILIDAKVWYTGPASLITKDWSRGAFLLSILIRLCSGWLARSVPHAHTLAHSE